MRPIATSALGAPSSDVIDGAYTLESHEVFSQSQKVPGSDLLLCVMVSNTRTRSFHTFLVGGHWSTKGFALVSMLEMSSVPYDTTCMHEHDPLVSGVGFDRTSDVQMDRIQRMINEESLGKPEQPSEASKKRGRQFED